MIVVIIMSYLLIVLSFPDLPAGRRVGESRGKNLKHGFPQSLTFILRSFILRSATENGATENGATENGSRDRLFGNNEKANIIYT